jgi:hypothetical protein
MRTTIMPRAALAHTVPPRLQVRVELAQRLNELEFKQVSVAIGVSPFFIRDRQHKVEGPAGN